jgi:hypothetical protein
MLEGMPFFQTIFMWNARSDWTFAGLSAACWLAALWVVGPDGVFPLNDDWAYARAVQHLLQTGQYDPGDWPAMTLWLHVLWGAAFCWLFGFSFLTLRLSVLLLAAVSALLLYKLLRSAQMPAWWSRLAVVALVFSPFFFALSLTFMTEIPFLAWSLGAVWAYRAALRTGQLRDWGLATLLSVGALLIRQNGLLLPLAFGMAAGLQQPRWRTVGLALGSIAICWGALALFTHWLAAHPGLPGSYGDFRELLPRLRPDIALERLRRFGPPLLFYAGFLSLPLLLLLRCRWHWKAWLLPLVFGIALAGSFWQQVPLENFWYDWGLGPVTLSSSYRGYWAAYQGADWIWNGLRFLGGIGLVLLFHQGQRRTPAFLDKLRSGDASAAWKMGLLLYLLGYYLFLVLNDFRFDRYLLAVQPIWILLLGGGGRAYAGRLLRRSASLVLLLGVGLFSVLGTHDYFAWNRVRWQALRDLQSAGLPPGEIDGGFEFNAWHQSGPKRPMGGSGRSWYFVGEATYVIDFQHYSACYERLESRPVRSYFSGKDSLLILRRPPYLRRDTFRCGLEAASCPPFRPGGRIDSSRAYQGQRSLQLTPEHPYGLNLRLPARPCERLSIRLWQHPPGTDLRMIASAPQADQFYAAAAAMTAAKKDGWEQRYGELRLPADFPADTLSLYLWLPGRDSVWVDGVEVVWGQN